MRNTLLAGLLLLGSGGAALGQATPRPLTLDEYKKAKTFAVKDLDADSYVKFENAYILDRYEARKPYFITGDDGQKKRIDLYKLVAKDGMQEIGTMVFYTTEKGKRYQALLPNYTADGKVWNQYFEDIHTIDREEKNFVLKLSYVLSKELAFQQAKALNQGKALSAEAGTYGNDICFPGGQLVALAAGGHKPLAEVRAGDVVLGHDARTGRSAPATVRAVQAHETKNYALTQLHLAAVREQAGPNGTTAHLRGHLLEATPNHPLQTLGGPKTAGEVVVGDQLLGLSPATARLEPLTVLHVREYAAGPQPVYNLSTEAGDSFVLGGVLVQQK